MRHPLPGHQRRRPELAAAQLLEHDPDPTTGAMRSGTVDSVDATGWVCVRLRGGISCYQAPGLALRPGQQVRFTIEPQPIDPADASKGTQDTIVWLTPQPAHLA